MELTTKYLGIELGNPLVAGASPLSDSLDQARAIEDAGAGALVMRSLFMEQILREELAMADLERHENQFAEALDYFPDAAEYSLGPDEYLEHLQRLCDALDIPVIGSLNGVMAGSWTRYAGLIAEAGASALELNVYHLPMVGDESPDALETRYEELLRRVVEEVDIPVAVKLTYHHSSPVHVCRRLVDAGASGLVLFNQLYQPDIDIEALEVRPVIHLTTSSDLQLRLLWLAAIHGKVDASLSATGGVHTGTDAVKAVMAGADTVQVVSAMLRDGPGALGRIKSDMVAWLEAHEYQSLDQARGSMSLANSPDPEAFERANYMKSLQTWA